MRTFKEYAELNEAKTVEVEVQSLMNHRSDGEFQEEDDFHYFIEELRQYGLKDKDWTYASDGDYIVIPAKYAKHIKHWNVDVREGE